MNAAQIRKLQNKVAAKFSAKHDKEEAKKQAKKDAIHREIDRIEKANPGKGVCIATHKREVYCRHPFNVSFNEIEFSFDVVEVSERNTSNEVRYWLLKPEIYKEHDEILNWFKNNYATIKMIMHSVNTKDGMAKLSSLHHMGGVFEDFQKKFPTKTMLDFIQYFKTMDRLMLEALKA